eukprot:10621017-Alexandrium_andersonii.AAC.1
MAGRRGPGSLRACCVGVLPRRRRRARVEPPVLWGIGRNTNRLWLRSQHPEYQSDQERNTVIPATSN